MNSVLVVDDDPDLLRFIAMTLNRGGLKAIPAQTGEEALRIFRRRHKEIALLLTDVVMPQTTGIQLCTAISALEPKLQVVFMTGYKTDHLEQFGHALNGYEILGKPFTPSELLKLMRRLLHTSVATGN